MFPFHRQTLFWLYKECRSRCNLTDLFCVVVKQHNARRYPDWLGGLFPNQWSPQGPIIPVSKSTTVQVSLQSNPYYHWRRDNSKGDEILFWARVDCIEVGTNRFTLCLGGLFVFRWREKLVTRARKVQPAIRKVTRCGWGKVKKQFKLEKKKL